MLHLSLLTICGIDELDYHSARGVTHVLSILDPEWPEPEPFWAYDRHHRTTLHFHDNIEPGPDIVLPQSVHVRGILGFGRSLLADAERQQAHLLVHCHAGISRSTAAMAILLAQSDPGENEDKVFARIEELRPQAWPNSLMIAFADELLGREGCLSSALGRFYGRQLRKRPGTERLMRTYGRGRGGDGWRRCRAVGARSLSDPLNMRNWPDRRLLDLLGIALPIIQAPMAGETTPDLVAAVSEAGGLGSLGCAILSCEEVRSAVSP
jgi:predicted protein tyrosine phosphatase